MSIRAFSSWSNSVADWLALAGIFGLIFLRRVRRREAPTQKQQLSRLPRGSSAVYSQQPANASRVGIVDDVDSQSQSRPSLFYHLIPMSRLYTRACHRLKCMAQTLCEKKPWRGSLPPCGRENSPYRHPANIDSISIPKLGGVF
jgi:hypothetical protein